MKDVSLNLKKKPVTVSKWYLEKKKPKAKQI